MKALTVLKKEIKDSFRDRRTLISSILIPALLIPILFLFMGHSMSGVENTIKTQGFKIAIQGKPSYLEDFLSKTPTIKIVKTSDPIKMLNDGKIQAVITVPDEFNQLIDEGKQSNIQIKYDQTNSTSSMGLSTLETVINSFSSNLASERLKSKGLDPNIIHPFNTKITNITKSKGDGIFVLSFLIPLFLMMWPAIGAMVSAADSGAGEKERGTLEPLLSTQADRTSIAVGKWLAISVASITGAVAFIIGFVISMRITPNIFGGSAKISTTSFIIMAVMGILISLMYSALMLAFSVFARNVKEANTYMAPVYIIAMVPPYLTFFTDIKTIPSWQYIIPFYNIVLVLKESLLGTTNLAHIGLAFIWSFILIIIGLYLVIKMYNTEEVVFRS